MILSSDCSRWSRGAWHGAPPSSFASVSTDSRSLPEGGCLYVALRGERTDGHAYVDAAFEGGATAALVDRVWFEAASADARLPEERALLVVDNTTAALTDLAAGYRAKVDPTVVGLTGSVGKTTVKELTARLLSGAGPTAKTVGNWNNCYGVPKSILAMPEGTRYAVWETGTNHPGEIAPLAALIRPDAAILTNIGDAHIGNFGSRDATANEKADLLRAVPPTGFAVLDACGAHASYLRAQCRCRVITVSADPAIAADYVATVADPATGALSVSERGGAPHALRPAMPGVHQTANVLLAAACSRELGVSWETIAERLNDWSPDVHGRWETFEKDGVLWIDDAYNANPQSMIRAIETFAALPCAGRRVAVLGDMGELGEQLEEPMHRAIGLRVFELGLSELVCVGRRASWIGDQARLSGLSPKRIHRLADAAEAKAFLATFLRRGDAVLLKASRSMALENAR